jgi:hypothetical protein
MSEFGVEEALVSEVVVDTEAASVEVVVLAEDELSTEAVVVDSSNSLDVVVVAVDIAVSSGGVDDEIVASVVSVSESEFITTGAELVAVNSAVGSANSCGICASGAERAAY